MSASIVTDDLLNCLTLSEREYLSYYVFKKIRHGDENHQKWLQEKLDEIFEVRN